jgi:hypothetical protein
MTGLVVHIGVNSERNDGETLTNLPIRVKLFTDNTAPGVSAAQHHC